jgi:hypothetical protein
LTLEFIDKLASALKNSEIQKLFIRLKIGEWGILQQNYTD